ncbi:FT-interacting protein 3-like [Diospyros lotus]|uniref:FT-interacting protein 3-like n=1 Tax=Diospyros lotus TaxID=55363 RepID=UPI002250EBC8|nr:FT-interacting protein 3-like [Diospyros lotus]
MPPRTQTQNPAPAPNPPEDFALKETSPNLGGDRVTTTFHLVEQMDYLYVRVVKAKELHPKNVNNGGCEPYVEVKLGNYKGVTQNSQNKSNPEWNRVFAFLKDRIQASFVEVNVKDKDSGGDDYIGKLVFELSDVPKRVPPDSPLAPQWYNLENRNGLRVRPELMLAVWMGTQADEAFPEAWHLDAAGAIGEGVANIRSKIYLSPKLWYLRVNVIEAHELQPSDRTRPPEVFVKIALGNVLMRTRISPTKTVNPMWNEDLMFVVAEPFEEQLVLSVEDKVAPNKDAILGKCGIPLLNVEKRTECSCVSSRWYNLEKPSAGGGGGQKIAGRIHMRVSMDGGYHVLDELTQYSSDLRATEKQLCKPGMGVLELGILSAQGLSAMKTRDGRGTTDAYCVAKYGQKWIRTRTIIDSLNPKWNEQYTWEVFDPCTVITIVAFDNCHLHGIKDKGVHDARMGKVRIRLSTLETDRVYTHSYPLIVLHQSGVKKMGEIQLAVRFTCSSLFNMIQTYSLPLLPKMHYLHPLSIFQQDSLRHQATQVISTRLSRAEPPLRREVVEYMLDVGSQMWSMRKSKAHVCRIADVLSGLAKVSQWFDDIRTWKSPFTTTSVHLLCLLLIIHPKLILSTVLLSILLVGLWNYRSRPRHPPHMDARLSKADTATADELGEEFDTFPSSCKGDALRARYDRLRCIAARMQAVVGDLATQGERFHSLLTWRDPRATALFLIVCLVCGVLLLFARMEVVALFAAFYVLRHPRFRVKLPSSPFNFFRRLPTKADSLL